MSRADVLAEWNLLVAGERSSSVVHEWADPRTRAGETTDPLVMSGLQILRGLTGTSSGASAADIARLRDAWLLDCEAYDADPRGWRRDRAKAALRGLSRDYPDRAPAAALVFLREGILTEEDIRDAVSADDDRGR